MSHPPIESFGEWVRERRKRKSLTQKALGNLIGYAEITVRQVESSAYGLTRFIVERLVEVLADEGDDRDAILHFALKKATTPDSPSHTAVGYRSGTPFLGRDAEMAHIAALLRDPDCRCISIVGVGGVGKTRLATRAFAAFSHELFQEAWFINLTELTTSEQAARSIAAATGIALTPFTPLEEQVVQALSARHMLLALDNFEQLLPESTHLLTHLLERASAIKLLITSRERLQISGEWSLRLQGLGMTDASSLSDAVTLFVSTAQRLNHQFVPDEDAILAICQALQGIPLAIEMAASWTDVFHPSEILKSLSTKVLDLTSRNRDAGERHKSLQVVFETTWDRLSGREQSALLRLAVFRGGFTRDAAQAVAATDVGILAFLQDKLLVDRRTDNHLVLHEMVRQLALQKLLADEAAWREARFAHAEYYIQSLGHSAQRIKFSHTHEEILKMRGEIENLRVAWDTMLDQHRTDWFDRCWESLWLYCNVTSDFQEGEALFLRAAQGFDRSSESAAEKRQGDFSQALVALFLLRQGRIPEAHLLISDATMNELRISTDPRDQYYFWILESHILHALGDAQGALASAERGLVALQRLETDPFLIILLQHQMGRTYQLLGQLEVAQERFQETLRSFRHHNVGWGIGLLLTELGLIAETQGKTDQALAHYAAVLAASTQWEEVWNYHRTQISIGRVKLALGRVPEASALFQATLQGLLNNPHLGLEIDCFVEIAPILLLDGKPALTLDLLEYCAAHTECFQSTRDRAVRYLTSIRAASPSASMPLTHSHLPSHKREIAERLLMELRSFQQSMTPPASPTLPTT